MVQACHAAQYAGFSFPEPEEIVSLVILKVANEYELFQAYRFLAMKGIKIAPFFEPVGDMGLSAIATTPLYKEEDRELFQQWEMWTPNKTNGVKI